MAGIFVTELPIADIKLLEQRASLAKGRRSLLRTPKCLHLRQLVMATVVMVIIIRRVVFLTAILVSCCALLVSPFRTKTKDERAVIIRSSVIEQARSTCVGSLFLSHQLPVHHFLGDVLLVEAHLSTVGPATCGRLLALSTTLSLLDAPATSTMHDAFF